MSLRVYNTLTRQKETFTPVHPGKIGMYLCGPTVYKSPHIGHMVGPIIFDTIKRYLRYKGYEVTWVVNITDVDDKLIDAAKRFNTTVKELAEKHTREYFTVLASLGIDTIDHFPKASEHIPEILELCRRLIERGTAYSAGGSVWFDVTRDDDYGKLSGRRIEEQASGLRDLEGEGKRNPADFALWKAVKPGEPAWDSPWGPGRPGWHIECSAMAIKLLGETFDIHGGGLDLMFPHHENELAQSESATGKPFARFWLHNGLTRIRTKLASGEWADEKMSGSLGNVVAVSELLEKHGAELIRYLILQTHYRRPIEFTDDVIASSKKGLSAFHRLFERVGRLGGDVSDAAADLDELAPRLLSSEENELFVRSVLGLKMKFLESMDDDFNTAGAIAVLHEIAGEINAHVERSGVERAKQPDVLVAIGAAATSIRRLGALLGLFRGLDTHEPGADGDATLSDQLMQLIIALRKDARTAKNFALADAIRNGLTQIGVTLEDRPDGTGWRKN
jgi:cysteinyl-tRNA synthetase